MVRFFTSAWQTLKARKTFLEKSSRYSSKTNMNFDKMKIDANIIFLAGVNSVKTTNLIVESVKVLNESTFTVNGIPHKLQNIINVVGFGKAVVGMSRALEELFGDKIEKGIISIPEGTTETMRKIKQVNLLPSQNSKIKVYEGARNNIPDENSFKATKDIVEMVSQLKEEDLLVVLISGGGSALLSYPKPPVTLEQKSKLIKDLSRQGASIQELNCVRKKLSLVKGGGLAQAAYPAKVISLILSDIIGDPLDLIASSPTVPNKDNPQMALSILQKYLQLDEIPQPITNCLKGTSNGSDETKNQKVHNYLIGSNTKALEAAKTCAEDLGYNTYVLTNTLQGEAVTIGKHFAHLARDINAASQDVTSARDYYSVFGADADLMSKVIADAGKSLKDGKPCCMLCGGETTVLVKGNGIGGRNQEMSLSFGIECDNLFLNPEVVFLSAGTDGIDGPTDAAGALAYPGLTVDAKAENLDPGMFLSNNDSYTFYRTFRNGKDHVITGHTGTNVMDIQILLIHPKRQQGDETN